MVIVLWLNEWTCCSAILLREGIFPIGVAGCERNNGDTA
ncbi:hypothetical protein A2U01_0106613, partial [Trifolium medium]|nr:hypothetical protein [Trifolium medium]